jgi:NCAIR mutase (PurE)-related protein
VSEMRHILEPDDAGFARLDLDRQQRTCVPEVMLADRKHPEDALAIVRRCMAQQGRAILSRVPPALERALRAEWAGQEYEIVRYERARGMVIRRAGQAAPNYGGRVGVLTAGTADVPIAEEATMLLHEMGCEVYTAYDVGVAGLHRLFEPLRQMVSEHDVDALVVAAGMDGALPSVVAGLVDVPVIGLPTSVGYGMGGRGKSALLSMLQTCSPGLATVNIDNGIGAAAIAGRIALRAARARQACATGVRSMAS